jgi:hypothetical protein
MKRVFLFLFCVLLTLIFVFSAYGQTTALAKDYKIGVFTGTVSQGEEEFRAAENMIAKYGEDVIVHMTYPDRFMAEQETIITNLLGMASDPLVEALVIVQAVPGMSPAIDKVRELKPDILIIAGVPAEDPAMIAARADIVLNTDDLGRGVSTLEQAHALGAKTFVHYTFPRHMSYELLSQRREIMRDTAEKLGILFVDADAPDPTGDAGVPGTQMFITEDVPRKVAEYGKDTALFGTNCSMMEPLIKQVVETGALFPVQCCPSPYHGYPGALGIEIPEDKKGNVAWILEAIEQKLLELGAGGRLSTWPIPVNMAYIEAGVTYAIDYLEGRIDEKFDKEAIEVIFSEITGGPVNLVSFGDLDNYLMMEFDHITFGVRD